MTHVNVEHERTALSPFEYDELARNAVIARGSARTGTAIRRLSPSVRLRNAIECNELSLQYQAQFDTRDGSQCGVEALARWFLPNGESIAPTTFIPAAEKNGLIGALGAWVLQEACSTVAGWRRADAELPILCVNLSPRQISRQFCALLAGTLERTGFPAGRLELEITENILIAHPALALDCLDQWKRLGVRIALDDFGTGYSSLSYLSRLPVDRIKIDKSLVHRMTNDKKTAAIVRAVISLGGDFGFVVLAEGVETEVQLAMLRGMGCQQVQGHLLAKPECADVTQALLASKWGRRVIPRSFPSVGPLAARANAS